MRTLLRMISATLCAAITACGGAGMSDQGTQANQTSASAPRMLPRTAAVKAGTAISPRTADATQARFFGPQGIRTDAAGNLYVADTRNYTIRRIATNGAVTTIAGQAGVPGSADGTGAAARFTEPRDVAADDRGNLYVTDGSTIRKITPSRQVTTLAGRQGEYGNTDGPGASARFYAPYGIAVDASGNVYVADASDFALLVRRITPAGIVSTFAGEGAALLGPTGLTIDHNGALYLTDIGLGGLTVPNLDDGATFVRKISTAGAMTTLAGNLGLTTAANGETLAEFSYSSGIAMDSRRNLYVTDLFDHGNRIKKISPTGAVSVMMLNNAALSRLSGLAIAPCGTMYVSDMQKHAIYKIETNGTATLYAGQPDQPGSVDTP